MKQKKQKKTIDNTEELDYNPYDLTANYLKALKINSKDLISSPRYRDKNNPYNVGVVLYQKEE